MRHGTRNRPAVAALTVLVLVLLGGCSDEPDVAEVAPRTPAPSVPPDDAARTSVRTADTERTTGAPAQAAVVASADGAFTVQLPRGWSDAAGVAGDQTLLALRAGERTAGFFTNLVVVTDEPITDLAQAMPDVAQELAGPDGAYELLDPVRIDGEPAYGYSLRRTVDDVPVAQVQRYVQHGDVLYVLTLSAAGSQQEAAQAQLEDILAGWSWR